MIKLKISLITILFLTATSTSFAQTQEIQTQTGDQKPLINDVDLIDVVSRKVAEDTEIQQLHAKFTKLLTGAKLTGQFTVDGKPLNDLTEETYEIAKVKKMDDGDMWAITARIKYGKYDLTVPVPMEVKWAGSTPVLTLDDITIPGMGTFGARVVLHQDKYAGTWQHDAVGGHLFGRIVLPDTKEDEGKDK